MIRCRSSLCFAIVFVAALLADVVLAHKLLVFTTTHSRSHMISNGRVADALARAGHDVTIASLEISIDSFAFNYTEHAKIVPLGRIDEAVVRMIKESKNRATQLLFTKPKLTRSYDFMAPIAAGVRTLCDYMLEHNKAELDAIRAEKFDAVFVEQLFACANAFGEAVGVKTQFIVNSCSLMDHVAHYLGIPTPLGFVPSTGDLSVPDEMSLFDRIANTVEFLVNIYTYDEDHVETTALFRKRLGPDFPDTRTTLSNVAMVFVAVDELVDFPRPIMHNIVYIGGLGMKSAGNALALPEEFEQEMKKGKKGVVFFSFGSNAFTHHFPREFMGNLIDAFAAMHDYHFIVKLEKEDKGSIEQCRSKANVFVTHWAPQAALLTHPRLLGFVTHAGYNSVLESAHNGVPLLLLPVFFDQQRNAQAVKRNGWGVLLDRRAVLTSRETVLLGLRELLENPSYKSKAQRIQKLVKEKPFAAHDLLTKNVKFILENGGDLPELRSFGARLNWVFFYNIDIFVGAALLALAVIVAAVKLTLALARRLGLCVRQSGKNKRD